jgi:hypothetical protein
VVDVYWGTGVDPAIRTKTSALWQIVMQQSSYLDWLQEYSTPTQIIGRGSWFPDGFAIAPTNPSATVSGRVIENELLLQIARGALPGVSLDQAGAIRSYYSIQFPPGYAVTGQGAPPGQMCSDWGAYHGAIPVTVTGFAGTKYLPYGVIPSCGSTQFVNSFLLTHELIEAITDPAVNVGPLGWYDFGSNGEIADLCECTANRSGQMGPDVFVATGHSDADEGSPYGACEWQPTNNDIPVIESSLGGPPYYVCDGETFTLRGAQRTNSAAYHWFVNGFGVLGSYGSALTVSAPKGQADSTLFGTYGVSGMGPTGAWSAQSSITASFVHSSSGAEVIVTPAADPIPAGRRVSLSLPGDFASYSWSNGGRSSFINVAPTTTTTYAVSFVDRCGRTGTVSQTVAVMPPPSPPAVGFTVIPRANHTATLLADGQVLIAGGGAVDGNELNIAERYDPAIGTFSTVPSRMVFPRSAHTATTLRNGKVLLAGGLVSSQPVAAAEIFDPTSGAFTPTGSLLGARSSHTATLLPSGMVLIVGGLGAPGSDVASTAEIYDPSTGIFSAVPGRLSVARSGHTASLLPTGQVVIAGGWGSTGITAAAELFDPASSTFTVTGAMTTARAGHTATVLHSGAVLIAGGLGTAGLLASLDLYEPATGTFSALTGVLAQARTGHTATLSPDGAVVVAGGSGSAGPVGQVEIVDDGLHVKPGPDLVWPRLYHTATVLRDGQLLLVGGEEATSDFPALFTAELYDPSTPTAAALQVGMKAPRSSPSATILPDGTVLVAGGDDSAGAALSSAEIFDPADQSFAPTANAMSVPRSGLTATLIGRGLVLIAGGSSNGASTRSGDLFDPVTRSFTALPATMSVARAGHSATLLADGRVLVAGGQDSSRDSLATAEIFDPAPGTFTPCRGGMSVSRSGHTATLLRTGQVLLAGGVSGHTPGQARPSAIAELFDPAGQTFIMTGALRTPTAGHTATLLPTGEVLVAGGQDDQGRPQAVAQLYDPALGSFVEISAGLNVARAFHRATLLPGGRVLLSGGVGTAGQAVDRTELYDRVSNRFFSGPTLAVGASRHVAVLLGTNRVLLCGGTVNPGSSSAQAEIFDPGQGYAGVRLAPSVQSLTNPLTMPGAITAMGNNFTGDSDGSSGSPNASPTNYPLLQLQRVDNDDQRLLLADTSHAQAWSDHSITSALQSRVPAGHWRATVIANGVPSTQTFITVSPSGPTPGRGPFTLRLFNVDDHFRAYLLNSRFTIIDPALVASADYLADTGLIDLSPWVVEGVNKLDLELTNDGGGWTFGYELRDGGTLIAADQCGVAGGVGCARVPTAPGDLTFQKTIQFTSLANGVWTGGGSRIRRQLGLPSGAAILPLNRERAVNPAAATNQVGEILDVDRHFQ